MNALLDNFPGYAKILRLSVAKEPWSIENGLVTPTLKLKRKSILDRYMDELDRLYEGH
jgi:long-chain acyl-CoA synthetase